MGKIILGLALLLTAIATYAFHMYTLDSPDGEKPLARFIHKYDASLLNIAFIIAVIGIAFIVYSIVSV